ncbi:serine/threonine-protein kinase [Thermomonospora umbrina]|uniref:non-specific serine/threonine protein kinase n=1 Tax=Thermomonospora umbrina TaxID=111806 RepID=A0A3D9STU5_9ACTN|nr:serine/threonine-protein kinase [Thermomonospora umbrina]REE96405.1 serine/threonine protein kinase [Thermomonospora umbrina]
MPIPSSVGRYRIDRVLGSGAFASVWLAHDDALAAPVAIKVLSGSLLDDLDVRNRFLEEARILRRADSERLVRVHDIGELPDGRPYFVMSYADRGTLGDRMRERTLPVAQAVALAEEIAHGVQVINRFGVIHRDLKPSNVLFQSTSDGGERLLIADLGLAKAIAHASGAFTLPVGTPGYMSPEQARFGGGLDVRADVYGLGALTYHMLTGKAPGPAPIKKRPSELRAELTPEFDRVILRAMEVDRENRWPTAEAFAHALATLRPSVGPLPPPVSPGPEPEPATAPDVKSPQATGGGPDDQRTAQVPLPPPSGRPGQGVPQPQPQPRGPVGAGGPPEDEFERTVVDRPREYDAPPQGPPPEDPGEDRTIAISRDQFPSPPPPGPQGRGAGSSEGATAAFPTPGGPPGPGGPGGFGPGGSGPGGAGGYGTGGPGPGGSGDFGARGPGPGGPGAGGHGPGGPGDFGAGGHGPGGPGDFGPGGPGPGGPEDFGAGGPGPGGPGAGGPGPGGAGNFGAGGHGPGGPGGYGAGGPGPGGPGDFGPGGPGPGGPGGYGVGGPGPGGPLPGPGGGPGAGGKGNKRLVALGIGAGIVVIALVGGLILGMLGDDDDGPAVPPKPTTPQDFTPVNDASGKIKVSVPRVWRPLAQPPTWTPSSVGLAADAQSRPVLRATSGTFEQFLDSAARTPGVFIGLTTDGARGKLPPARVSSHDQCTKGQPESYTSPDKALTGTITRYTACRTGTPTVTEVGLTDRSGRFGAWIRVKEIDDRRLTTPILNTLKLAAP